MHFGAAHGPPAGLTQRVGDGRGRKPDAEGGGGRQGGGSLTQRAWRRTAGGGSLPQGLAPVRRPVERTARPLQFPQMKWQTCGKHSES